MHISDFQIPDLTRLQKQVEWLDITPRSDGGMWQLPLLAVTGRAPGPSLVVVAGVHGDEYEGIEAIHRVFEKVVPEKVRGTLVMVPVCNVAAYAAATRSSPIDGLNLARVFPGRADGSLTEQIAYWISERLIAGADFFIDLHSAGVAYDIPTLAGYIHQDDDLGRGCLAGAQAFGAPVLWGHPPPVPPGRSISTAMDLGVPCLYTEAAGAGRTRPEDVDCYTQGVLNVMHHLDILPGDPPPSPPPLHLLGDGNLDEVISAPVDGHFQSNVELLEEVQPGQLLGTIHELTGQVAAEVRAEQAGIVILRRGLRRVHSGDGLFQLTGRC